jgi:hypothetical protein
MTAFGLAGPTKLISSVSMTTEEDNLRGVGDEGTCLMAFWIV